MVSNEWHAQFIQPEDAAMQFFQTSKNDSFTSQNNKNFLINIVFVVIMVFSLKFVFSSYIPNIFESLQY